jgi:hypothetical protein
MGSSGPYVTVSVRSADDSDQSSCLASFDRSICGAEFQFRLSSTCILIIIFLVDLFLLYTKVLADTFPMSNVVEGPKSLVLHKVRVNPTEAE